MKKNILFAAALFAGSFAFAQGSTTSMKNKKGLEYLPQAGDWAIQFDAAPLLNYVGNAFSNSGTSSPGMSSPFGNSVFVGKYMTSATEAWRVKVGINLSSNSFDSTQYNLNRFEYVKTTNFSTRNITLGFGKEWRRGHNRLQGFYGAEALVQIGSSTPTVSYEYNLDLKAAVDSSFESLGVPRSNGITKSFAFGIGARGFIGVEYFIMPKISLGGEFGWGIGYQTSNATGESEILVPTTGGNTEVRTVEGIGEAGSPLEKRSGFVVNNDNGGTIFGGTASLNISFYF